MLSFWIAVKRQNRKDSKIINIMIVDLDLASTHSPDKLTHERMAEEELGAISWHFIGTAL